MARPNPIRAIMETELPSKTYQRRKLYRPNKFDVILAYNNINRHIFNNQLIRPHIEIKSHIRGIWGCCNWMDTEQYTGSHCFILLSDKWFCPQWFVNTLAHEMVHQWQWDVHRWDVGGTIYEDSGAHGPSFFTWRERFSEFGLNLKTSHGQKRWFKHQDFTKC
jgi:hypothetical protein